MKARVLWVVKGLGPGGAEHLLLAAARAHDPAQFDIECAYVLPWKDHLAEQLEHAGVPTHCLSTKRHDRRWPLHLRELIQNGNFDIVHVHSPLPGSVARVAVRMMPKGTRPAVVCTEHNVWSTHNVFTRWANRLTGRWDAKVLAVTDESRLSMRGPMAAHAETLAHGIDVATVATQRSHRHAVRAEFGIGDDEFVVGTVANFREQKDYPNLLAAARLLVDRETPVQFVAVGQGPLETEMRARRDELGLADRVIFTGFRDDATRVMAAADVFTLASRWEGLPVALMEALALGLPVVATNVGGVGEAMHDGIDALLVPPGDPAALADALQRVCTDQHVRERLAVASAARASEFDVSRAVQRLEQVYAELVRPHPEAAAEESPPEAPSPEPKPARRRLPQGMEIRAATPDDRPAILELGRQSLGWGDDPRFQQLYAWKHDQNAFGPSPTWVATDAGRIVGLRAFMRWEFTRGGTVLRAVRAVDTATHPDYQGKGLFTALTLHGLDEMLADGVHFVFNTPNPKSRAGYLKMGWQLVGRLPAAARVAGPISAVSTVRSRVSAHHWSLPLTVGEPFLDWLDREGYQPRAAIHPSAVRDLRTNVSEPFLRWRYGIPLLQYRAIADGDGALIVRARERGSARELVMLGQPSMPAGRADKVAAHALRAADCNHALRIGEPRLRNGFVTLPGGGPVLTWRALNSEAMPPLSNWRLGMGDVELF